MDRAFSPEETRRILHEPPYWRFCWASGLAVARYLAEFPEWVKGKRVLDFGAGSGLAAIAACPRVRDFRHPLYQRIEMLEAMTLPDLAEPEEFRHVSRYHAQRG